MYDKVKIKATIGNFVVLHFVIILGHLSLIANLYVNHMCLRCWSMVGRVGGEQKVSIGRGCERLGTAIHEISHSLGFWHEQVCLVAKMLLFLFSLSYTLL